MAKNKVTASNFYPHLLAIMGKMTDFTPGVPVVFSDTFKPVCDRMGIAENSLGMYEPTNSVKTHHLIGLAFRTMRSKGLGFYEKRGVWMLTQEGVLESKKVQGMSMEDDLTPEDQGPVLHAAKVQDLVEGEEDSKDVVVRLPRIPQYHGDAYIRSLAIEQTPCFGSYSSRASVCGTCPLAQECEARMFLEKSLLAEGLEGQETNPNKVSRPENESIDDLIASFDKESSQTATPTPEVGKSKSKAHRDSLCIKCNKTISKGDSCFWVKNQGLMHLACS
jgi:hypothetical protein